MSQHDHPPDAPGLGAELPPEPLPVIAYDSSRQRHGNWVLHWLEMGGWCVGALVFLAVGGCLLPFAMVLWPVVVIILALSLTRAAFRARRYRAQVILGHLASAVRLNLPLADYISAAAQSETGQVRRRLRALAENLASGTSVANALGSAAPEVPDRAVGIVAAAERCGQLQPALVRLLDEYHQPRDDGRDFARVWATSYPIWMLAFVGTLMVTISIFVVPKFREIFRDFRAEPPLVTRAVVAFSTFVSDQFGWVLLAVFPLLVLILLGAEMRKFFRVKPGPLLPERFRDRVLWYLPVIGTPGRNRSLADLCTILSDAVEAGRSIQTALLDASALHLNTVLQERVYVWTTGMAGGLGLRAAAAQARLPHLLVELLGTGERTGELAGPLRFLARYYESHFSRARVLAAACAGPAVVLLLGTIVGTVVYALFLPLVYLIRSVTEQGMAI